jgi:hypothetical protein
MSTSETSICNLALLSLGQDPITDLAGEEKAARYCRRYYPVARDACLQAGNFGFSRKRKSLAQSVNIPVFGWAFAYELPNDFLKVLVFNDTQTLYEREGNFILTDEVFAHLRYIARVEDTNTFDALFVDALASRVAMELAVPLARSSELYAIAEKRYRVKIAESRTVDSQTSGGPSFPDDTGWLEARG